MNENLRMQILLQGYYIGDLSELVDDISEFNRHTKILEEVFETDKENNFIYRNVVKQHPEYSMFVDLKDLPARRKLIYYNQYGIGQQWYESMNATPKLTPSKHYFQDILNKFIPTVYNELSVDKNNIEYRDNFSVFTEGDFIEPHVDGQNKGRLCVVLIYMSEPSAYNENSGGELVITNNDLVVSPIKGRFVLLDFTKHDHNHEVKVVKNNFNRYTYISFVYNKDEM